MLSAAGTVNKLNRFDLEWAEISPFCLTLPETLKRPSKLGLFFLNFYLNVSGGSPKKLAHKVTREMRQGLMTFILSRQ